MNTDLTRKITRISCICLLVLFVTLWGASYWNIMYCTPGGQTMFYLDRGRFVSLSLHPNEEQQLLWKSLRVGLPYNTGWTCHGFRGLTTHWTPKSLYSEHLAGIGRIEITLWMPTVLIGAACYLLVWRRKRRVGYCTKCNYDLTGNVTGICPECGKSVV